MEKELRCIKTMTAAFDRNINLFIEGEKYLSPEANVIVDVFGEERDFNGSFGKHLLATHFNSTPIK